VPGMDDKRVAVSYGGAAVTGSLGRQV
jgi:hypothetical protein